MIKDLRIENLNDFEVVSELIIGVSYLTGKKYLLYLILMI